MANSTSNQQKPSYKPLAVVAGGIALVAIVCCLVIENHIHSMYKRALDEKTKSEAEYRKKYEQADHYARTLSDSLIRMNERLDCCCGKKKKEDTYKKPSTKAVQKVVSKPVAPVVEKKPAVAPVVEKKPEPAKTADTVARPKVTIIYETVHTTYKCR